MSGKVGFIPLLVGAFVIAGFMGDHEDKNTHKGSGAAVVEAIEKAEKVDLSPNWKFIVGVDNPTYGPEYLSADMVHAKVRKAVSNKNHCNELMISAVSPNGLEVWAMCKDTKGNERFFVFQNEHEVQLSQSGANVCDDRIEDGPDACRGFLDTRYRGKDPVNNIRFYDLQKRYGSWFKYPGTNFYKVDGGYDAEKADLRMLAEKYRDFKHPADGMGIYTIPWN